MRIRKTQLAETDLDIIYRFGFERFGALQADQYANELFDLFELLAFSPLIERERLEFARPVRIHPFKSHVVVYEIQGDALVILRVLSRHQNLPDHL
jgi:toxin ParE1/3/4